MTDKQIQNLVSGGIAVMFGFVAFTIINKMLLGRNSSNVGGGLIADESTASAGGTACGASGAPSTFLEGTSGCNYLHNCEANGGIPWSNAMEGGGYELGCDQSNMSGMTVTSTGGSKFAPVRRSRSFF